jgi:transcriptional regulator with XRE-family HTH domain
MPRRKITASYLSRLEKRFKTQKALAEFLGVSTRTVRYWKEGKRKPSEGHTRRIREAQKPPEKRFKSFKPDYKINDTEFYQTSHLTRDEIFNLISQLRTKGHLFRFIVKTPGGSPDYPEAKFMTTNWIDSDMMDERINEFIQSPFGSRGISISSGGYSHFQIAATMPTPDEETIS